MVNYVFLSVYFYSVPNLRFPSFSHDWKIYTFDDIASYKKGPFGSALKKDLFVPKSKESVKVYEQQNAINKDCHLERYFISANYYEKMKSFTVYPGDTIVSCAGTIGELYTLPENADIGIINQALMIIRNNQAIILKDFLNIQFSRMIDEFSKTYSNGSAIKNIPPFSDLKRKKTYVPDKLEQEKIIKFISLLDQKITTQIKIIDDYMTYRNAIVDYFFESLSSDWNRIKLSNILKEYSELHVKDNSIVHATLSKEGIFPKTDRYDRDFLVKDEDKKYKVTHLNDICYNPANLKFGVITRNTIGDCIISPIYVTFKIENGFLPKFVELLVTRKRFISRARKYEQGTVYERMAVNSSDLLSMYVSIPSLNTQQTIVNIINNIDNKISNEKELLKLYRAQKVYLLKNMFI